RPLPGRDRLRRGRADRSAGPGRLGHAGSGGARLRGGDGPGPRPGAAGRRGAAVAGLLELRHVHQLRAPGPPVPRGGGVMVTAAAARDPGDLRWETRLLVVVTAVLTVFGIASLYAAATLERGAFGFFLKQLVGALAGALVMIFVSRMDYHRWRALAWPILLGSVALLLVPLLPF